MVLENAICLPIPLTNPLSKINSRVFTVYNSVSYNIFNYDRRRLYVEEPCTTTKYRSVIYSYPEQQLLSFSPPRSISLSMFSNRYPISQEDTPSCEGSISWTENDLFTCTNENNTNNVKKSLLITEIVEGLLVHLFYDARLSSWEIATKNAVGGRIVPFRKSETTFEKTTSTASVYSMFLDALRSPEQMSLNDIPVLEIFEKQYSYTFVLQHPKNPIVLPIQRPTLYLVAVYDIIHNGFVGQYAIPIPQSVYQRWRCFTNSPIQFPTLYDIQDFNSYESIQSRFGSVVHSTNSSLGINITNTKTGDRCQIKNPAYLVMKRVNELDGLSFFQYLCLKRIQKEELYVKYYPEEDDRYIQYFQLFRHFVKDVHSAYLQKYVIKSNLPITSKFSRLIDRIHKEIRIPSLHKRSQKSQQTQNGQEAIPLKITHGVVYKYIRSLDPMEILHLITQDKTNR